MGGWLTVTRKVVVCGPTNSGKTTLKKCWAQMVGDTVPTMGFDKCRVFFGHAAVDLYDTGGVAEMQVVWSTLALDAHAVIFVVDATRLSQSMSSLSEMNRYLYSATPILIFLNKQDLPNAVAPSDLQGLTQRWTRPFAVFGSSFAASEGLNAGLEWLLPHL